MADKAQKFQQPHPLTRKIRKTGGPSPEQAILRALKQSGSGAGGVVAAHEAALPES